MGFFGVWIAFGVTASRVGDAVSFGGCACVVLKAGGRVHGDGDIENVPRASGCREESVTRKPWPWACELTAPAQEQVEDVRLVLDYWLARTSRD